MSLASDFAIFRGVGKNTIRNNGENTKIAKKRLTITS